MEQANLSQETKTKQNKFQEHHAVKELKRGRVRGGNWLVRGTKQFILEAHSVRFILGVCAAIYEGIWSAKRY